MVIRREETAKKKKQITFMLLPHSSSHNVFKLNLPYWLATLIGAIISISLLIVIISFIYSAKISTRLIRYYGIQAENKRQESQLKVFVEKTKELESGVRELEERDQELREMLGLQKKSLNKPTAKKELNSSDITILDELQERMAALTQKIETKQSEYGVLKEAVVAMKYKFDNIPSIWPVDGAVISHFGWRRHPFTGGMEFHKGLDIPSWVGRPVRAAADGVVSYAAWSKGFGNTIMIDHKNGYETLYGHCSQLMVQKWQHVRKGEIIASVGSTGLSTGPHVHYEIHLNKSAFDPSGYLDLNIRSAQRF